jgi:hypothetical protein
MNRIVLGAIFLGLGVSSLAAEFEKNDASAPKTIVEQFLKMETEGGRENVEGWETARKYFVHSSPFVPKKTVLLIDKDYTVWKPVTIAAGSTSVTVDIEPIGRIGADLRFSTPTRRYYKSFMDFKLILVKKRWERDANGVDREINEPSPRWLVDKPNDTLTLNLAAAIRYVSQQRDATDNPVIKRNADQTLAKLKSLH